MKNYIFLLIIIILFGTCEKNNENIFEQPFFPTHWTVENLRLRDKPDTRAKILQTLQTGTAVQKLDSGRTEKIDDITAPWLFIQTEDGQRGWCFGGYLADESSLILGIWEEGENETGLNWFFYYFTADKVLNGIFASGYFGVLDWSIEDNYIHFDGKIADHDVIETVFSYVPFAIIDYNTIKINETIFIRISEQDLLPHHTSKDHLDKLMETRFE
jgi:hypothetical protein